MRFAPVKGGDLVSAAQGITNLIGSRESGAAENENPQRLSRFFGGQFAKAKSSDSCSGKLDKLPAGRSVHCWRLPTQVYSSLQDERDNTSRGGATHGRNDGWSALADGCSARASDERIFNDADARHPILRREASCDRPRDLANLRCRSSARHWRTTARGPFAIRQSWRPRDRFVADVRALRASDRRLVRETRSAR